MDGVVTMQHTKRVTISAHLHRLLYLLFFCYSLYQYKKYKPTKWLTYPPVALLYCMQEPYMYWDWYYQNPTAHY